ncbi:MAG: hypothetical protein J0L73_22365 [Verrucomicrobia bacterium]|nr:hypothetical protein [Verrucomicrobiota bacterium]
MKIPSLLLAAAAFMLASCIEIKSTVIVSKDGTATIEESVLLGAQLAAMMQGGQGDQLKGLVMDKEKAEERAKKLGEGVTVKSHEEVKTPDGKSGVKVVFAVADLSKLKYVPFEPEQEGKPSTTQPMTFALSGSTLTITNPDADKKKGGDAAKPKKSPEQIAMMKSQMAMMKPMFAGMRVAVAVQGANGIASSNAAHLEEGTISYMDIQFDKIMDNADIFTGFMESADVGLSPEEVAEKFKNVDGLKIEGKKVVTAELK